ncbi:MAG: hypothetical protein ACI8RZ_004500 [Myxococcota bacterium]|jgi:hypothetical protein
MTDLTRAMRKAQVARAEEAVRQHYTGHDPHPTLLDHARAAAPDMDLSIHWLRALLSRIDQERPALRRVERTAEQWAAIFPRYPIDGDGFAQVIPAESLGTVQSALSTDGVAVIGVLSEAECAGTVAAMFEEINGRTKASRPTIDPARPHTWHSRNWPSSSKFLLRKPALHPVAFAN